MKYSVNITLQELVDAIQFANENEKNTITMHFDDGCGIGALINVSKTEDFEKPENWHNITDFESW